ncbi:MAG: hypothetical protein Fur0021_20610 [Candidatus Promineifilaceae bacterium]
MLATVTQVTLADFHSAHLQNERDLVVLLPSLYEKHSRVRFPVLYVNDGQDIGQLRLHETLARLVQRKRIRPLIVVAIPSNANRLHEYGTAVAANAQGLGTQAAAYARFVVEEVMPAINANFRTLTTPTDTAILGASLGGLSAFDIAWNYPEQFGTVGVLSGSFWWRAAPTETVMTPNALITHNIVRCSTFRPGFRAWFEAGTRDERDDRDRNGVIDAIQDTTELIDELEKLGYRRGVDVVYQEINGGQHNYDTWAKALPDFLEWAFVPHSQHP